MLAFRSLDPFRALREPDRRRRDDTLPTLANAASTTIKIVPGFPTDPAKSSGGDFTPFAVFFANPTTMEGFGQRAAGKLRQAVIQSAVDRTDRRGREAVAAQLLGDRLHLAGRNTLHI